MPEDGLGRMKSKLLGFLLVNGLRHATESERYAIISYLHIMRVSFLRNNIPSP